MQDGPSRRRVEVGDGVVIGRSAQCQLVLSDTAASRCHLEIVPVDGAWVCRDLGSRNGLKVNNQKTSERRLDDGDRLLVGETVLRFHLEGGVEQPPAPSETPSDRTMFMPTVLDEHGRAAEAPPASRPRQLFETAYTLMNAIATQFDPCELATQILEITSQAIKGRRAAILYAGEGATLQPCSACGAVHSIRNGTPEAIAVDDIEISESIATRVLTDGESVLFRSARSDATAELSLSMRALNLTSVLCVPMRAQDRTLGILYIDTDLADRDYTEDELLLAAAAGNSAGLALENARIHQSLLERNRLEQEVADAWAIQEGFLVKDWPDDDARFRVYGETRPAKTVGGDFYDFIRLDDDRVGLLIGDVSGKGIPAALTMAQLLAEFRMSAGPDIAPAEVLARINAATVLRTRRGTFCSMCYLVIDLATGRLVGANAGHHPALLVTRTGPTAVIAPSGPPVGIISEAEWSDDEATMRPGDGILLYTDGIVEARSGQSATTRREAPVQYERWRLEECVVAARSRMNPREVVETVMRDVEAFSGSAPPFDDRTMIGLRMIGDA